MSTSLKAQIAAKKAAKSGTKAKAAKATKTDFPAYRYDFTKDGTLLVGIGSKWVRGEFLAQALKGGGGVPALADFLAEALD